jgi:hypothetical protein
VTASGLGMPCTSSPSSFRVHLHGHRDGAGIIATLSLLVILLCLCLDLRLAISMDSDQATVARYVCMGCQGPVSYFSTYKAAACHFANSPPCNQSGRSIRVVTIQARPGDRVTGTQAAPVQLERGNPEILQLEVQTCYKTCYITPLLHSV